MEVMNCRAAGAHGKIFGAGTNSDTVGGTPPEDYERCTSSLNSSSFFAFLKPKLLFRNRKYLSDFGCHEISREPVQRR